MELNQVKTLNKSITRSFFKDDLGFKNLEAHWKLSILTQHHEPSFAQLLVYAIVRGKDYTKGIFPIANEKKLANGMRPYECLSGIWYALTKNCVASYPKFKKELEFFKPFLSDDAFELISKVLPEKYNPESCYNYRYAPRVYVLVRKDLSPAQQVVQACHVAYDAGSEFGSTKGLYLVLLELENLQHLEETEKYLESLGITFESFYEPDIGQKTAICTDAIKMQILKDYNLFQQRKIKRKTS